MFDNSNEERELLIEKLCDETLERMSLSERNHIAWDFLYSNFKLMSDKELMEEAEALTEEWGD